MVQMHIDDYDDIIQACELKPQKISNFKMTKCCFTPYFLEDNFWKVA